MGCPWSCRLLLLLSLGPAVALALLQYRYDCGDYGMQLLAYPSRGRSVRFKVLDEFGSLFDVANCSICLHWLNTGADGGVSFSSGYEGCHVLLKEGRYVLRVRMEEVLISGVTAASYEVNMTCPQPPDYYVLMDGNMRIEHQGNNIQQGQDGVLVPQPQPGLLHRVSQSALAPHGPLQGHAGQAHSVVQTRPGLAHPGLQHQSQSGLAHPGVQTQSGLVRPGVQTQSGLVHSGVQTQSGLVHPGAQTQPDQIRPGVQTQSGIVRPGLQSQSQSVLAHLGVQTQQEPARPGVQSQSQVRPLARPQADLRPGIQPEAQPGLPHHGVQAQAGLLRPGTQPQTQAGFINPGTQPQAGLVNPGTQPQAQPGLVHPGAQPQSQPGLVHPAIRPQSQQGHVRPGTGPQSQSGFLRPGTQSQAQSGFLRPGTQSQSQSGSLRPGTGSQSQSGSLRPGTRPQSQAGFFRPGAQSQSQAGLTHPGAHSLTGLVHSGIQAQNQLGLAHSGFQTHTGLVHAGFQSQPSQLHPGVQTQPGPARPNQHRPSLTRPGLHHQSQLSLARPVLHSQTQQGLARPEFQAQPGVLRPGLHPQPGLLQPTALFYPSAGAGAQLTREQCHVGTGRIPCAAPQGREGCVQAGCCYDDMDRLAPCYYGNTATVHCLLDGHFIIVVPRGLSTQPYNLDSVRLASDEGHCGPAKVTDSFVMFRFPVTQCGTTVQVIEDRLIYENQLISTIDVRPGPRGSITRDSIYILHARCIYNASDLLPVRVEVAVPPTAEALTEPGPLRLQLRIASDESYSSYHEDSEYPLVKVLRDPIYVEVRLLQKTDPNLVLVLHQCWASPSTSATAEPQWPILVDGCPFTGDNYRTQLLPVGPASQQLPFPSHYQRFVVSTFTFVESPSMAMLEGEVYIFCSASVCHLAQPEPCRPSCQLGVPSRARRSLGHRRTAEPVDKVVSQGRIIFQESPELQKG